MNVKKTLVLSRTFSPQRVVDRDKAICMIFSDRISLVLEVTDELMGVIPYDRLSDFKRVIRAYGRRPGDENGDLLIFSPSVVSSSQKFFEIKRDVSFNRDNVYMRDNYTCQYCGREKKDLTYDHVIPRSRGGRTTWDNIVTSCVSCNYKKGCKTPEQAGMTLKSAPDRPTWYKMIKSSIINRVADKTWISYI